ncbi:MAG: hypothetical protein V1924_08670 [Candidatus Bathyarchaeota archaeon]
MVDLASLQAVSYIMGSLGVFVAAVYYVLNIQNNRRNQELSLETQKHTLESRQTQLTMHLYEKMSTKEYLDDFNEILLEWSWTDYEDFQTKYGSKGDSKKWHMFGAVCINWEQIGILMKYGAFNPDMLYDQWSGFYIRFWEKIEPIIVEINSEGEGPGGYLEYAEDLYYFFKESSLRDRVDFNAREQVRQEKRVTLGLRPRPVCK